MNPRAFIILAAITAVTVIGAAIGVAATYTAVPTVREEALMFPRLIDRLDDVATIVVRHTKGEMTMNRGESGWGLAEKGGYPIAADKVRKAMVQLAGLRLLAPKTTKAERFPRLQVEDVTAEGAKSKVLEMKGKDGTSLAQVIVGKYRFDLGGDGKNGVYVRRPGENRAWLARGGLNISQDVTVWLQRSIVDVLAKRVREVANVAPDDTVLTVYKMKPSDKAFVSLDIPADAKRKKNAGTTLNDMGSALSLLDLQDVVPAADMDFSGDGVSRAEFQTFDGLIIRIALIMRTDG